MESERSKLLGALSTIENVVAVLASVPGFLSLRYHHHDGRPELHMSAKGFKSIFSRDEVAYKKFSWDEESGFKYKVAVAYKEGLPIFPVVGIKVFCLMEENELEEYLGPPREAQMEVI